LAILTKCNFSKHG